MTERIRRSQPRADRFKRGELQEAYELGYRQEYRHDSFVLLERFEWLLDDARSACLGAERMAAMLEGAADALRDLACARRDDLPALRALDQMQRRDG